MSSNIYSFFDSDYVDVWKLFDININKSIDKRELLIKYNKILKDDFLNNGQEELYRFGFKLLMDDYYLPMYKKYKSINLLYEAGFFLDNYDQNEEKGVVDNNWLSTPINKIKIGGNKKEKVVLLMTGAFSPIHSGHVNSMEIAKSVLSNKYDVIGGYISPSHDEYVDTKHNGQAKKHIMKRIMDADMFLSDNDWIMVDKYEGVDNKYAINFTDVIVRLKSYLEYHLDEKIKICYVFGGDNAKFTLAFLNNDMSFCISRNHENESFFNNYELGENNYYIKENKYKDVSSTKIRNEYINKNQSILSKSNNKIKNYLIRDDWDCINLDLNISPLNKLREILNYGLSKDTVIKSISVKEQNNLFLLKNEISQKTISLDVYIKGDYNIGLSRQFNMSDSQIRANKLVKRPESNMNVDIPNGNYTVIEDDSVSGQTLMFLKNILGSEKNIDNILLLSDLNKEEYYDVVDLRDFILNAKYGGLVVNFKSNNIRVPYMYPYVNLVSRASIEFDKFLIVSYLLWKLNLELVSKILSENKKYLLGDNLKLLISMVGLYNPKLSDKDNVVNFCLYHIQNIEKIIEVKK